jgi:phospholipid/cholesterol/gamma-HCH transport system substrate-binding protein/paraquat-inducible protein B
MSAEARYLRVGIFVFLGAAAIAATALVLAGRSLFAERVSFETYFDESVQGLEVGSPVKLRGVAIGRVSEIGLVGDFYDLPEEEARRFSQLVVVRMEALEEDLPRGATSLEERRRILEERVQEGFRLQLRQSGITGVSFIEGTYVSSARYPALQVPWEPAGLYVPSTPSTITALTSAAERVAARLERVDTERLVANLDALLVSLRALVEGKASATLDDLRATLARVRKDLDAAELDAASADLRAALQEVRGLAARARGVVEEGEGDAGATLENLRIATDNLRSLSETLRGQPSLLLRGAAPSHTPLAVGEETVPE